MFSSSLFSSWAIWYLISCSACYLAINSLCIASSLDLNLMASSSFCWSCWDIMRCSLTFGFGCCSLSLCIIISLCLNSARSSYSLCFSASERIGCFSGIGAWLCCIGGRTFSWFCWSLWPATWTGYRSGSLIMWPYWFFFKPLMSWVASTFLSCLDSIL